MADDGSGTKTIQSAETVFDILEAIDQETATTLPALAEELEYSRSTIFYYLKTLSQRRCVVKDGETYQLGPKLLQLGGGILARNQLRTVATSHVRDLADETSFVACAAVRYDAHTSFVLVSSDGTQPADDIHLGAEYPIHATAYGKAILARLPAEERQAVLADDQSASLEAQTGATLTDPDTLTDDLDSVRELGFAFSDGECWPDVRSIAAPVLDSSGEPVGSVGVSGPADSIENPNKHAKERRFVTELPKLVSRTARSIENQLDT